MLFHTISKYFSSFLNILHAGNSLISSLVNLFHMVFTATVDWKTGVFEAGCCSFRNNSEKTAVLANHVKEKYSSACYEFYIRLWKKKCFRRQGRSTEIENHWNEKYSCINNRVRKGENSNSFITTNLLGWNILILLEDEKSFH